jgi:putative flippase GtrA
MQENMQLSSVNSELTQKFTLKLHIETILDFFYPLFRRFFDKTTYRYAVCGGVNTIFDIFLFFLFYQFVLDKQNLNLGLFVISSHIASFLLAFLLSFPAGFLLMRFVVFQESQLKGRIQFFRYLVIVLCSLLMNYFFLKLFVEYFHFYPTIAKIITTFFVVTFSYFSQRNFSFKTKVSA